MNAFNVLNSRLLEVIHKRGFQKPTEIQQKSIPVVLKGENCILLSGTGTGKTEAAILPILNHLLESGYEDGIQTLYVTPLRALNRDIIERMQWWCNHLSISIAVRHGDTPQKERRQILKTPPQLLITTPETFQLLLPSKMRNHLKTIRWVVIDEIHSLANNRRGTQLALGLRRLERLLQPTSVQIVALSATLGNPEEVVREFLGKGVVVQDTSSKTPLIQLDYALIEQEDLKLASDLIIAPYIAARLRKIKEFILEHQSVLVFVNKRTDAELLGSRLKLFPELTNQVEIHHSSLDQEVRCQTEKRLKRGELRCIVTTSSLELGIDVGKIDAVVQYLSPRQATALLQRVGRSRHQATSIFEPEILIMTKGNEDAFESLVVANRALKGAAIIFTFISLFMLSLRIRSML